MTLPSLGANFMSNLIYRGRSINNISNPSNHRFNLIFSSQSIDRNIFKDLQVYTRLKSTLPGLIGSMMENMSMELLNHKKAFLILNSS